MSKEFCKPQKGCKLQHITNFNVADYGTIITERILQRWFCIHHICFSQKEVWASQVVFFSIEIILHATKTEFVLFVEIFLFGWLFWFYFGFFSPQRRYKSRLMANITIKQLKFIKKSFKQNLEGMLESSWCTAATLVSEGGTTLVTSRQSGN